MKSYVSYKDSYMNIHNRFIYNNYKLKTTQMSLNK